MTDGWTSELLKRIDAAYGNSVAMGIALHYMCSNKKARRQIVAYVERLLKEREEIESNDSNL